MDWADGRAREWMEHHMTGDDEADYASLAALLREVEQAGWIDGHTVGAEEGARDMVPISADRGSVFIDGQGDVDLAPKVLAEVRRVVDSTGREHGASLAWRNCCDEILARLDKLA